MGARFWKPVAVWAVLGALVVAGAGLVLRKQAALASAPRHGDRPQVVRVATAEAGRFALAVEYLAVVEAGHTATVSARVTASILLVSVAEGDTVEAGEVLAVLDGLEVRDGLASMDAQIEQTGAEAASQDAMASALKESAAYWQREAGRQQRLFDQGAVARVAAESASDRLSDVVGRLESARLRATALRHQGDGLRKRRAQMETQLGYYEVRSPFAGVVREVPVEVGDLASPGRPLVVVEDRRETKLAFDVPQEDVPRIQAGAPVRYTVGDRPGVGEVVRLFPSLDRARVLRVEARPGASDAPLLRPGEYLTLSVEYGDVDAPALVPRESVVPGPDGNSHVFIVAEGRVTTRPVRVMGSDQTRVGLEGVAPGEQVVTSTFLGWARLADGAPVEAM